MTVEAQFLTVMVTVEAQFLTVTRSRKVKNPATLTAHKRCYISKIVPTCGESSAVLFLPFRWYLNKLLILSKRFSTQVTI